MIDDKRRLPPEALRGASQPQMMPPGQMVRRPAVQPGGPQMVQAQPSLNPAQTNQSLPMTKAPVSQTFGQGLPVQPIGREQVQEAFLTLNRYRTGKANLEQRIIQNEQWYKMRHWGSVDKKPNPVEPASGWLFNAIANKHADAMDNFPAPNILPREEGDKAEAEKLSSIVPVVLEQNDFEATYDDVWDYKLKAGTGVYGVFWDKSKLNGLGDISIQKVDLINLFWESGITDIQRSRNLFHVELMDNEALQELYPQLKGKLGVPTVTLGQYVYDDTVDTTNKSAVIDWYYKRRQGGKTVLHYCKFVNDTVLFATENEPAFQDRGWYDHGLYPFVFDPLFSVEGSPCGFGYIDIGKSAQEYIDRGNQAVLQNMLANARPRHFIRTDGEVNEEEYADLSKDFIHVQGNLGQDSILPVQTNPLNDIYVTILNNKIDELKEVTGNRDISTGGTTSGVTAASAIAAMQEAGSKLSRDNIKASYRAFRKVVLMVIELIRQFYDVPRCFRIMGEQGAARFVQYSNQGIQPQQQGSAFGVDMGYRLPLFDIEITAQKQSPYSKMSQNELALQFYQTGIFNPAMADQAMACLDMMDFDRKEMIMQRVAQNGGMYQQLQQLTQILNQLLGIQPQQQGAGGTPVASGGSGNTAAASVEQTEALGGSKGGAEASNTKKARQKVAESTAPA